MPQLFLGATFGLSLPISYSIAESTLSLEVIFLYIGCIFWIIAYDTYYALCDLDDDKLEKAREIGKDNEKKIDENITECMLKNNLDEPNKYVKNVKTHRSQWFD